MVDENVRVYNIKVDLKELACQCVNIPAAVFCEQAINLGLYIIAKFLVHLKNYSELL